MLDEEIDKRIAGPAKIDLPGLVEAMGEAATTDLRAEQVLPLALRVIGTPADPKLADAVAKLRAWVADGAHRRDRDGDGVYEHAEAIRILDAFWPRWMRAQFQPSLGEPLFDQLTGAHELDNTPNNHGAHHGLGLPGRLVRLRRQGPAPGARAEGARAVLQALLRRRPAHALSRRAARPRWPTRSPPTRRRSTATPPAPPPASPTTRPASTRSSSARRARSRSR